MSPEECPSRDLAAAYVLGALPDREGEDYARHLGACPRCDRDVAELQVVADVLPSTAMALEAPAELKDRVMSVVRAEAELLRAGRPSADRPAASRTRRPRWLVSLRPLPAAALAAVLLALGVGAGTLLTGGGDPQRSVRAVVDRQAAPDARAELRVGGRGATLVVAGLPAPPRGRIYQVWLDDASDRRPPRPTEVLFSVNRHGRATVDVPSDLRDGQAVLVTHEPLGGSAVPSRTPIITARPA